MDHCLTFTPCHHTKLVKNKIFHECIFEMNGECVGDMLIDDISIHDGPDVIDIFFHN
jgi:hypothetical protein